MKSRSLFCYYSLIGALLALPSTADSAGIRVGNASRSNSQAYQQINEMRYQAAAATQQAIAEQQAAEAAQPVELPIVVEDRILADQVRSAHPGATVTMQQLERCSMVYPDGEFVWAKPTAGIGAGTAPKCTAVVEMRAYQAGQNGQDLVVARTKLAAGEAIKCNISDFPESSWLPAAEQIEFPADNPPTMEDVKAVMNQEQKQNAGIKILAGAVVGGLGGNIAGKNEVGHDGLLGGGRHKAKSTAIGALGGAALMAGNAYSGKVAGDMILSTGVNAAAGAVMGNIVASGDSVMRIEDCEVNGRQTTCLWGVFEKSNASGISSSQVAFVNGNSITSFRVCNKATDTNPNIHGCKYADLTNVVIQQYADAKRTSDNQPMTLKDMFAENWQRIPANGKFCLKTNGTMDGNFGSDCTDGPWIEIQSASTVEERVPAMLVDVQDKGFGWKQADWSDLKKRYGTGQIVGRAGNGQAVAIDLGKDENNQPIKPTIDLFTPVYRDAEDGGVVDLSNKARLKGTLTGAGVGAGMGAMSGYQGAQDDITQRYLAAKREYDDSMQKIYCVTGRHFLAQYNDMAFVAPVNEPNEQ